jgi:hypothetical protein
MESSLRPLPSGLSGLLRDPPSQSTLGTSGNPLTGRGVVRLAGRKRLPTARAAAGRAAGDRRQTVAGVNFEVGAVHAPVHARDGHLGHSRHT